MKLVVHRKAYTRKPFEKSAYTRKAYRRKNGVYVKSAKVKKTYVGKAKVPATTFKITDRGAKGRGKSVVKIKHKGLMTKTAENMGLITPNQHIKSLSRPKLRKLADRMVSKFGARNAKGMFQAQALYRKRASGEFKNKMQYTSKYIGEKYGRQLTPRRAISKWQRMSHRLRAKAMPERKGRKGYRLIKSRWRKI